MHGVEKVKAIFILPQAVWTQHAADEMLHE
jgi:hypothetical protein